MEIILSRYAGFCEGVNRAYDIVEKIAKDPKTKRPVFVLGSLVHNSDVVERIEQMGVKKVNMEESPEDFFEKVKNEVGTLVITAHGIGPKIYELAEKYGIPLVDTTCPRVIKVQRLAKNFLDRGTQIVIIGEKKHREVEGIFQWADRKATIIETEEDLKNLKLDSEKKIAVISQTTQDQEFVDRSANYIKKKYPAHNASPARNASHSDAGGPQAEIINSICLTTHDRQGEIKKLARKSDVVIVIGSPESANSTRLWEIARRINPKSYFIQRSGQLKKEWFAGCKKVAVTAGASTPGWVIDEVIAKLQSIEHRA